MHKFILMLGMENISFTLLQHYLPGQFYKVPKGQGGTRFLYSFNFFMHFGATGLLSLYGFYCWRYFFVHDNNNNNSSRSLKSCVSALALHLSVFFSPISYYTFSLLCKKCPYQHNYNCFKHTFLLLSILINFNCATNLLFTLRKKSN